MIYGHHESQTLSSYHVNSCPGF